MYIYIYINKCMCACMSVYIRIYWPDWRALRSRREGSRWAATQGWKALVGVGARFGVWGFGGMRQELSIWPWRLSMGTAGLWMLGFRALYLGHCGLRGFSRSGRRSSRSIGGSGRSRSSGSSSSSSSRVVGGVMNLTIITCKMTSRIGIKVTTTAMLSSAS